MFSDFFASMSFGEIILIILGAAILGYLIRYFSGPKATPEIKATKPVAPVTPEVNEWEVKYKSFQANYEQNKNEWLQKNKSSEDRAKTYQSQLVEIKALYEKTGVEKAEFASKLRVMEAQRNEALESAKKTISELLAASENIKAQQEKINSLSAALAMASNIKRETPKPIIISDEELTKKYEVDTAALKNQLEEKDKRVISLLSKEAAANELQLRNDKLASENKILRNEMATANLDAEVAIQKAQQLKDLQLQVLSLTNKVTLTNSETMTVKKQLAEQQKRHHQQAGKLNELRMSIGQERNAMKAKIEALENELAPFKPVPVPETEQITEAVPPILEAEKAAPLIEQMVVNSPEIDTTPVVVDFTTHLLQEVLPEPKTGLFATEAVNETLSPPVKPDTTVASIENAASSNAFPVDEHVIVETEAVEPEIFPIDPHETTLSKHPEETPVGKQNDLLLVQGIDAKVKTLLENEGIDSWGKLAKTSAATLKTILNEKGEEDIISINPKSWPIQAQLLADGKWDAFTSYSKYLIGGVDPEEVKA